MQEKFNGSLSKGRVKVEQTFGIWKKRWSINKTGYRLALANIPTAVLATCILHNIAIDLKIPITEDELVLDLDDEGNDENCLTQETEENVSITERQARLAGVRHRNEIAESIYRRYMQQT